MMEIDLDHPIWNSPAGFGADSAKAFKKLSSYCSIGKFNVATQNKECFERYDQYSALNKLIGVQNTTNIFLLNDTPDINSNNSELNHWKAVSLMLERLAEAGCTFKGTFVKDIIKESVC